MRTVDPGHFRSVMGNFATGVTVITATAEAGPVGMTANAVASLSLEPLLLLVAFDNTARTLQVVRGTERFGVNVLGAGQEELARLFASKAPEDAKFAGVPHSVHDGLPVLDGAIGHTLRVMRGNREVAAVKTLLPGASGTGAGTFERGDYKLPGIEIKIETPRHRYYRRD